MKKGRAQCGRQGDIEKGLFKMSEKTHHVLDLGLAVEPAARHDEIRDLERLHRVLIDAAQGHGLEKHGDIAVRHALFIVKLFDPRGDRKGFAHPRALLILVFTDVRDQDLDGRPSAIFFITPDLRDQRFEQKTILLPELFENAVQKFEKRRGAPEIIKERGPDPVFSVSVFFFPNGKDTRLGPAEGIDGLLEPRLEEVRVLEFVDKNVPELFPVPFSQFNEGGPVAFKKSRGLDLQVIKIKKTILFLGGLIGRFKFERQGFKFFE